MEAVLDPVAHITTLVERSRDDTASRLAFAGLARLAGAVGQHGAANDLWDRAGDDGYPGVPTSIGALAALAEAGRRRGAGGPMRSIRPLATGSVYATFALRRSPGRDAPRSPNH
ncbi:MAG: hypothetical protein R2706_01185 [Acidimicrobiales bacterium]